MSLPVRVAAVNDYEVIVEGVAALLSHYPDRLLVCDRITIGQPLQGGPVDVALYDTYGRAGIAAAALRRLAADPEVGRVAVFSMDLRDPIVADARRAGADAFISKGLSGDQIADAIVAVARGDHVFARSMAGVEPAELDWPGRAEGLTEGESQVLVLLGEGRSNTEIAEALYLSVETVKSRIKRVLAKLDVRNRVQAAVWVAQSGSFTRYQPPEPPT